MKEKKPTAHFLGRALDRFRRSITLKKKRRQDFGRSLALQRPHNHETTIIASASKVDENDERMNRPAFTGLSGGSIRIGSIRFGRSDLAGCHAGAKIFALRRIRLAKRLKDLAVDVVAWRCSFFFLHRRVFSRRLAPFSTRPPTFVRLIFLCRKRTD